MAGRGSRAGRGERAVAPRAGRRSRLSGKGDATLNTAAPGEYHPSRGFLARERARKEGGLALSSRNPATQNPARSRTQMGVGSTTGDRAGQPRGGPRVRLRPSRLPHAHPGSSRGEQPAS